MADEKKPGGILGAIGILGSKPKKPEDAPVDDEGDTDSAAGDALLEAIGNKDAAGIAAAVRMCVDAKKPEPTVEIDD